MMINVQNLGKKYQKTDDGRVIYHTLRDNLANMLTGKRPENIYEFWALKDVSFQVNEGDVVGVLGRNGAGKSTLLKLLSRITAPTTGSAELHGRVGSLLEVGTGFHLELTGRENIFVNGAIMGMNRPEIQRKFDDIVEFSGVGEFLDMPVKHYSSGMITRLAFSVAAFLEPEILVIDEVLATGDDEFQKRCMGQMKNISKSGRTILFVSHNMNAINQLCNRLFWLERGTLKADTTDVYNTLNKYLIGEAQENSTTHWLADDTHKLENDYFTLKSFALVDAQGGALPPIIPNDQQAFVEIKIEMKEYHPPMGMGYCVTSERGERLYWSFHNDTESEKRPDLQVGEHIIRAPIPRNMLNEGSYQVEFVSRFIPYRWIVEPGSSPASLVLQIRGGLSKSSLFQQRREALLAPEIVWSKAA
ncbi:MAG: ATP-binding cassette domain-containing protein [Alphaproteobacteria bacterium]|nr:ATP-binding cassette domain-containing protein [Alphaproteobacteria bacterium]